MAYKDNWLRHFFAGLTGDGSKELARDFWSSEDLWNPSVLIRYRWLKLTWVCFASTITEITVPGLVLLALSSFIKGPPTVEFVLFFAGGISAFIFSVMLLIYAVEYRVGIRRMKQSMLKVPQRADTASEHSDSVQTTPAPSPGTEQGVRSRSSETRSGLQETSLVVHSPEPAASLDNARFETRDGRSVLVVKSTKVATCKRPN